MVNHSIPKTLFKMWLCVSLLFTIGVSQSQLAMAADTSYADNTSKTAEELRLEYLEALEEEQNKLYFENFATNPDDIPISEYEGGTDRYFGDLILEGDELILKVSGGKLLIITRNERQEQLRQQLMKFVSEHSDVSVKVGIQGLININNDPTTEDLNELVLVNYNGLEANATHNIFKMLSTINDQE
ncbi:MULTISPECIES: hypothetical protein [unclassified Psychrobacter]|uniref:hypothetical protein n=1 Tax=unclassified Psychrobacter TaxID=196806 RepID=UPI0018669C4E|nr:MULTISPECIES: hypothetical protein [unclassified Psychrobacter]MBE8608596.1 hypothetical protein [Pseudomonas lundensis]